MRRSTITLLMTTLAGGALPTLGQNNGDNHHAFEVESQFLDLKHHSEALGFERGVADDAEFEGEHYQAIARYDHPETGTPYMFLTRTGKVNCNCQSGEGGELVVARMGSRPTDGGRLRSNRLLAALDPKFTPPYRTDTAIRSIHFEDNFLGSGVNLPYKHPGGIQIVDGVLVIGLESPYRVGHQYGAVVLVDVRNPENPRYITSFEVDTNEVIACAAAKIPAGWTDEHKYVIGVLNNTEDVIFVYHTQNEDLRAPGSINLRGFIPIGNIPDWNVRNSSAPQTFNFVRQAASPGFSDALYVITAWNSLATGGGTDYLNLYQVNPQKGPFPYLLEQIGEKKHQFGRYGTKGDTCNFAAGGAGVHVSPEGNLMLYSCDYQNDGPCPYGDNDCNDAQRTIPIAEFTNARYRWNWDDVEGGCSAWIELYEDPIGWFGDSESLALDSLDAHVELYKNLSLHEGFNDKAGAIRYYAPPGVEIVLHRDPNASGDWKVLHGDGVVRELPFLAAVGWDNRPGDHMNDRISSVTFRGPAPPEWLVPEQGSFAQAISQSGDGCAGVSLLGDVYSAQGTYAEGVTIRARVSPADLQ